MEWFSKCLFSTKALQRPSPKSLKIDGMKIMSPVPDPRSCPTVGRSGMPRLPFRMFCVCAKEYKVASDTELRKPRFHTALHRT